MKVKTIFIILIGVILLIVVSFLVIEMFNIHTTGQQIQHIAKMGIRQSCVLFSQETYKARENDSGAISIHNIKTSSGADYVSGNFYGSGNADTIYRNIYTKQEFKDWCKDYATNWDSLTLISKALNNERFDGSVTGNADDDEELGNSYEELLVTPMNMGVPYIDKDVLEKIVRWSLSELYSNGKKELIIDGNSENGGESFIRYKGFKVYANQAKIKKLNYEVFDITNDRDKERFEDITHINPDELGFEDFVDVGGQLGDERTNICIVGVEYEIPTAYEGITPLKNLASFIANNDVEGMDGNLQGRDTTGEDFNNNQKDDLTGGGYSEYESENANGKPVPGKLIYYVVR